MTMLRNKKLLLPDLSLILKKLRIKASAAAVASSSKDALETGRPVKSQIIVEN